MKRLLAILIMVFSGLEASSQDSLIRTSIYFGGGSYYIDEFQVEELQQFIESIERLENYEVIVFSHTDNIGGREYNEWLSRMRSGAVIEELLEMQVPAELIKTRNFGLSNPLYTNTSHNGRVMNRRVDVILWPIVF
ncbi:OmpA family protein [Fulvivirga ulvae]|uniref:OmpA family protein n=1 Tax=Fulvivirga ulvae TaxID=2904245 RepID=UPI001F1CF246|nr:OmpA family protein [Fulvivirga ulvae]UII31008.1 OmpA family protein [Fulvivirga ulvae]